MNLDKITKCEELMVGGGGAKVVEAKTLIP